jgi:microcystin-dependent protein
MAYPTNKYSFVQTNADDKTDAVDHNGIHNNLATTVNALQDKVGINSDTATTSFDYKLSEVTSTDKAVGKTATQTLTNKTLTSPTITDKNASGTDSGTETLNNKTLNSPKIDTAILDSNGNEVIATPATASAVNEITVTNSATGNDVQVTATGSDTNIGLKIKAKGSGRVKIGTAELQIPNTDGTAGQFIQTDGAGNLSFGSATGVISGAILQWATGTAPTGYLLCDGSAVSRTTFATLFGIISTSYGAGDGSTTFNLPDMRGRAVIGVGTGTKVATFASRSGNVITVTGLTNKANNEFQTGVSVRYSTTGSVITGLTNNTDYFVVRVSNTTFSLASTLADAQNGIVISLSSDGSGTQTFTETFAVRALGETGGEENHAMSSTELLAHSHTLSVFGGGFGGTPTGTVGPNSGSTSTTGGNATMNNMQPFIALNFIIKT